MRRTVNEGLVARSACGAYLFNGMENKVQQALALLREAGRLDLLVPEALMPGRPVRRASAGVAARSSSEEGRGQRAGASAGRARRSPAVRRYGARPGAIHKCFKNKGDEQPRHYGGRRVGPVASSFPGGDGGAEGARWHPAVGGGDGGRGMATESGEQRDPLVPISSKWPTMLVWSSEEDGGARSDESEVESAGEGPSKAVKAGNPGRGTGPLGGDRPREEVGSSVSEEEGVLEAGFGEGQLSGRVGAPGTPDLFGHGPLDFEDDDPGEQRAALSPWEEEKASPRAASRMASSGRHGRRRRAADASARLCGGVGDAPPDAAAWEEQRLGPVRQWRYGGEAAGCAQCKGSGVKGWKKSLEEEERRSVVTLEEGELRSSGSESEWWERQGRGVANPVRQSLQVSQVNSQSKAARERLGEQRKVQERPPLLSPVIILHTKLLGSSLRGNIPSIFRDFSCYTAT
ncbi:hypothetical protein NDU88_002254 [Pleurodeles waltl]|uniref:Uncharacterized protein n=1 Tax=Pleurodeles waltl TaxID=8319 RepID=A0AAV7W2C4_PLEWA|nr:hypothetical protein NDU88_002254 [Pleurodeles waltl]